MAFESYNPIQKVGEGAKAAIEVKFRGMDAEYKASKLYYDELASFLKNHFESYRNKVTAEHSLLSLGGYNIWKKNEEIDAILSRHVMALNNAVRKASAELEGIVSRYMDAPDRTAAQSLDLLRDDFGRKVVEYANQGIGDILSQAEARNAPNEAPPPPPPQDKGEEEVFGKKQMNAVKARNQQIAGLDNELFGP